MTELEPAGPPAPVPALRRPRPWHLIALGLLAAVVGLELTAGAVLRPPPPTGTLKIPGVEAMLHGVPVDPTELAQVAAARPGHSPLAIAAQALIDGLLLVMASGGGRSRRRRLGPAGAGSFLASLAILVVSIAVAVGAIARLRYLVGLYLSPPLGTLGYLLQFGSFPRRPALVVLAGVLALKAGAALALAPRAARNPAIAGLALTSLAAAGVMIVCYSWAPATVAGITDALAAAMAALAAIVWSGIIVSRSVRRLT